MVALVQNRKTRIHPPTVTRPPTVIVRGGIASDHHYAPLLTHYLMNTIADTTDSSMTDTQNTKTSQTNGDTTTQTLGIDVPPSQLILPDTDAGLRLWGYRADRLAYLAPGGGLVLVGAFAGAYGLTSLGAILVGVGILLISIGLYLIRTTPNYTSGIDRMRGRLAMALRSRSLPLDRSGAAGVHGVETIHDDGAIEMSDGRIVRFARLSGRNTDFQTDEESQTMVNSLRRRIDSSQRLSDVDFSVYLMNAGTDVTDITAKYRDVWESDRYDRKRYGDVVGYLKSILDFEPKRGEISQATDWEIYLVVHVDEDAIDPTDIGHVSDDAVRQQQQVEAESRLTALREAFGSVPGVGARPITAPAHARVIARHWAGTRHPPGFDGITDASVSVGTGTALEDGASTELPPRESSLSLSQRFAAGLGGMLSLGGTESAAASSPPQRTTDRIQELLAGSRWDVRPDDDMVVAGNQFCRTYYIGDWPVRAKALFLKELHTLRGIDLSVHHRFESRETETAKDEIQQMAGSIDASAVERDNAGNLLDAKALETEMDAYVTLFLLLDQEDIQAWDMSSYVTVRAGDRTALQEADRLIEQGYDDENLSIEVAKRKALNDACDEVEETLSSAGLTPRTDAQRQDELFRSAAPTGRNTFAEKSSRKRKRLCGTGTLAATFPPCSTTIQHEMGAEIGRTPTTGQIMSIDPFKTPPAMRLTLGKSGSGKTWATQKQVIRWYLSDPDERTLIFVDNKGRFSGVTGLLNGNRITIGGRSTINPMQMKPLDQDAVEAAGLDPFWSKHRFVVGLILDLICETDDARDRFRSLVRDGVEKAMLDAGLDPDDAETHTKENSPTLVDVRDAVAEIADEPSAHVRYEREEKEIDDKAGELLHKLGGFAEDGEFRFLTGESDATIEPGDVTYLDLQQSEGVGEMDHRTTMLSVALGQVYEAVKTAPEKTMVVIDEAHHLMKSQRILSWLEEQSRHWRHNDGGLWFISQHPKDFVVAEDVDEQQHKNVIRDQAQITEYFHTDDKDVLADLDLNSEEIAFLTEQATMGDDSADEDRDTTDSGQPAPAIDRADCLIDHPAIEGRMRAWITMSDAEYSIFSYDRDDHGSYGNYIETHWSRNDGAETDRGGR